MGLPAFDCLLVLLVSRGGSLERQHLHRQLCKEVHVPLVDRPAENAQADFLDIWVALADERRGVGLLLCGPIHSGRDYVQHYERQD